MEIWPREGLWHNLGQLFSLVLFKLSHWDWKSWSRGPQEQNLGGPRDAAGFLRWPWFPPFLTSALFNFPWVLQNTLHYPLGGLKQLEFIVSQLWWPETYHHSVGRLGSFWWLWGKTLPLCLSKFLVAVCNPWHAHVAPFPTARMYTQSPGCHGTPAFPPSSSMGVFISPATPPRVWSAVSSPPQRRLILLGTVIILTCAVPLPISLSPARTSPPTGTENCLPQEERPARRLTPGRGVEFPFIWHTSFVSDFKMISNIQKRFMNRGNSPE